MQKNRASHAAVLSQKAVGAAPLIIWTFLLELSLSRTRNNAKLAEMRADDMMVYRTSKMSPAVLGFWPQSYNLVIKMLRYLHSTFVHCVQPRFLS